MRPKILLRTHYQAAEPRLLIAAVTSCSSPTDSRDEDSVAAALVRWSREVGYTLSLPGAVYAVGNDRSIGLLNDSQRWTAGGLSLSYCHFLDGITDREWTPALGCLEQRVFLKYYIAHAGALLLRFGAWLLERGSVSDEQLRDDSVLERLLVATLDDYLSLAVDIRDRTTIRQERDRLARSQYVASTKRHKRYPLLAVMRRLALLDSVEDERGVVRPDPAGHLAALVRAIPTVNDLERLDRQNSLATVVASVLGDSAIRDGRVGEALASCYSYSLGVGLQACPLQVLDDVVYARFAFSVGTEPLSAEKYLEPLHRRLPGEVRFHVDRQGRPAFVLLTDRALAELAVQPDPS